MQGFKPGRSETRHFHAAHEIQRVAVGNVEQRDWAVRQLRLCGRLLRWAMFRLAWVGEARAGVRPMASE